MKWFQMCEANSLSYRICFQSLCKTWTVIVVMGPWVLSKGGYVFFFYLIYGKLSPAEVSALNNYWCGNYPLFDEG